MKERGFSLIEVVLAIGVATFALVSIVGLLSIAVTTSGDAGNDTMLTAMSAHVRTELRAAPFDALGEADPSDPSHTDLFDLSDPPLPTTFYFTTDGLPTTDPSGFETLYECKVTKTLDEKTRSPKNGPYNLIQMQLHFSWPVTGGSTSGKRPGQKTTYASIARY